MKNKNRSWKTTLFGAIGLLLLVIGLLFVWFEKATFTEVGSSLGLIFTAVGSLGLLKSKDEDKTGLPKP